jgi:hypothetical protein
LRVRSGVARPATPKTRDLLGHVCSGTIFRVAAVELRKHLKISWAAMTMLLHHIIYTWHLAWSAIHSQVASHWTGLFNGMDMDMAMYETSASTELPIEAVLIVVKRRMCCKSKTTLLWLAR